MNLKVQLLNLILTKDQKYHSDMVLNVTANNREVDGKTI
jgi:hypothetical protein